jgi:hypothetical protein
MNTANYFNIRSTDDKTIEKTIRIGGVKSTMCLNRFELLCEPDHHPREELILQMLQEWMELREREIASTK